MLFGRFDEIHEELVNYIEQIRDFLLVRGRIVASFCGSDKAFRTCQGYLAKWIGDMRDEPITPASMEFEPFDKYPREALAAPVQVGYCTQVIPAPHYSHPDSILLTIGSHILLYDYILPEIRLKGNAYSAGITHIIHLKPFSTKTRILIRTLHVRWTCSHTPLTISNRLSGRRPILTERLLEQQGITKRRFDLAKRRLKV